MNARKDLILLPALLAILALSGCLPEERFWWSPSGDRAVVVVDGRMHLVKADGDLGPAISDDPPGKRTKVDAVNWLPDGRQFVCQRVHTFATWEETRALIPEAEADAVEAMQSAVLPILQATIGGAQDTKSLEDLVSTLPFAAQQRLNAAVRREFERDPSAMERLLAPLPNAHEIVDSLRDPANGYEVSELALFTLDGDRAVGAPSSLLRSLQSPLLQPRVSPRHDAVAYLRLAEDGKSAALEVLPLTVGGSPVTVSQRASGAFAWMPDGRSLVFTTPIAGDGDKLQGIHRLQVLQEDGAPLNPGNPVTLATAVSLSRPALAALPNGRVLFASQVVAFPAAATGAELESRLFLVDADGRQLTPVPTAPGALPANLAFFAASPDGRHVAVVESETDAVAVVELQSGKTEIIAPPHRGWQCTTMPAWKSATELTFAALHPSTQQPKWMMWTPGGTVRCINDQWPAATTAKWLQYRALHKTPPATPSKPSLSR